MGWWAPMSEKLPSEKKLSATMREALNRLCSGASGRDIASNTATALEKRGLLVQQSSKWGLSIIPTLDGYHILGRKHPYEEAGMRFDK
jgi:hypothetical protein